MDVIRARALGFCFGVRDAIHAAMRFPEPHTVAIHGELVHNRSVLDRLEARGFALQTESDRDDIPATPRVMITAHGVSDRARRRFLDAGKEIIDTTCPLVRRAHAAALRLQNEGRFVVVVGRPGHVEVEGVTGDLDRFAVVASPEDVASYDADAIGVIYQTTTQPELACDILAAIHQRNPAADIRSVSTICQPTRDRQAAVLELLPRVDALVVVGSRNSNNTRQLVALAHSRGLPCIHVQTVDELDETAFDGVHVVGLTAGTSTPDDTIDAVEARLRNLGGGAPAFPAKENSRTVWAGSFRR